MTEEPDLAARAAAIIERHVRPKLERQLSQNDSGFPLVTKAGRWLHNPAERWSDGFWPGIYWRAWQATRDRRFRDQAARQCALLPNRIESPEANYDLGFLFSYSHALGFALTGETAYREVALRAAHALCSFASPTAGVITITYPDRVEAFGRARITTKIDVMMNLTLLWWAHAETGDRRFLEVAARHATRSLDCLLREDGSVWELADFDPGSGTLLLCGTKEGVEGPSCWARAQAWAIYGFLQAAKFTGGQHFFGAAECALSYWLRRLPEDGMPYWDLLAPETHQNARDSSAAAIVLAALIQSRCWGMPLGDPEVVARSLASLESHLTPAEDDGLLSAACAYYRKGVGVNEANVWGDYYLMEALCGLVQSRSNHQARLMK